MKAYLQTYSGRYALRSDLKHIKGEYYHKDDLIKFNGRWNRVNNGRLAFNINSKKWVKVKDVINEMVITEIAGITYCSHEPFKFVANTNSGIYRVFSKEFAAFLGARYVSGFYSYSHSQNSQRYEINLDYSFNPSKVHYQQNILDNNVEVEDALAKPFKETLDMFFNDGFSLGIECETSKGLLDMISLSKARVVPVRDGSIEGVEFVSAPIYNSSDFNKFLTFFNNPGLNISQKCSTHIHVGGLSPTEQDGSSFYYLCCRLQDELHGIMPAYKRSLDFLKKKEKDHSRLLHNFGLNYSDKLSSKEIFPLMMDFLCGGKRVKIGEPHPMQGNNKWNFNMRYYAFNLLNLYFSSSKTVEFRLFPPSLDSKLICIWSIISLAIAKVAREMPDIVFDNHKKINLIEVLIMANINKEVLDQIRLYIIEATKDNAKNYLTLNSNFSDYLQSYSKISNKIKSSIFVR